MLFLLLLLLPGVRSQAPTASSLLVPANYQRHPFNTVQFVQPKPTKKGPILFPNDAPPPPPPPLIVTSRPLSESIARSELNPNNSLAAQSQRHQVTFKPEFLARGKSYKPFSYALATVTPIFNLGQQSFANDEYPVKNRKDYYNDYEKRIMQTIHARRDNTNRERTLWEQPIQRRKIEQNPSSENARKTIFDNVANSMQIKVDHRSLYSREVNDNVDDADKDFNIVYRRSNNEELRNGIPMQKPENHHYYDDRNKFRRLYKSNEIHKKTKTRPVYNLNKLNLNDDLNKRIPIKEDAHASYIKSRKSRPLHSQENLSRNDNSILKQRAVQNLNDDTNKIAMRPLRDLEQASEENIQRIQRKRTHVEEQSDGEEVLLKRRPLLSQEYTSDNNDRIPYEPLHAEYKMEDRGGNKIIPRHVNRHEIHQRRPTHSAESEEVVQNRPVYNPDSRSQSEDSEETQQRPLQPLYNYPERSHVEQKIPPKPTHFKYQQRFKTLNRKDRQPTNTNYYNTHDGDRDTSKEYNHGENYAFSYTVKDHKTGDDFSHSQQSTGSATNGEYRVRLPDGRMQIVSYTADENGYKADVKYDDQHEHDNSIDGETSKENRYRNDDIPKTYKHHDAATYNDHFDSRDTSDREYLSHHHKGDISPSYIKNYSKRPTAYGNHQEFDPKHFEDTNLYAHKTDFTDTTKVEVDEVKSGELTENNNDYLEHYNDKNIESNDNVQRTHNDDYFQFTDEIPLSKEIMDYSSEFSRGYEPHKSKYSSYKHHNSVKSSVRPSYEELKDLFVTNAHMRRQNTPLPVVSTAAPHYDVTTENVVVISPKNTNLYTNIRNIAVPVTPTPLAYSTPFASTPRSYLVSTIANLKNKINLANKPILSHAYINKINKYLSYK